MKALIYKDLLAVWKYCRSYLFMCGAILVSSVFIEEYSFMQFYPLIFMGTLVNTLIAYDERDKWDRQVLTMPVTRKQYVTAKYLTGLLLLGTVLAYTRESFRYNMFVRKIIVVFPQFVNLFRRT